MRMDIFFDVDDTLIAEDDSLRPYVHEVFDRLVEDGHRIYLWSGGGIRWDVVDQHDLRPYVSGCYDKYDCPIEPDLCVDDDDEILECYEGVWVKPYYLPNLKDREMIRVYHRLRDII